MLVGLVLGLLGLLAVPATPAAAHAALVGSSPAQNSVVAQPPNQVVLTFTESVTPVTDRVHVIAPDGANADTGQPRTSGDQLIIPLKPGAANGTYLVNYRVISADSHPVGGAFSYSVGAPSAGGPPSANGTDQSPNSFIQAAFPVARWIGYVGLLLFVGAVLVLMLLWPNRLDRRDPIRVIWVGAGMIALATVLELLLQVPYVAGGSVADFRTADVREVLASQFGAAHLIRLGVLSAALVLVRPIVRGKGWGADRVLLAVLGAIGVATWSVSGHPSASSVPMVTVVADMIHIASMSVWLGGLIMLIGFVLPRASGRELAAIIPIWSRWAAYAVSALLLTGVAQALVEIGDLSAVFTTTYSWLILAKIGLAGIAIAVASQSRRLVPIIASRLDSASLDAGSNGASVNGASVNGATANGATVNGASFNGASLNGARASSGEFEGADDEADVEQEAGSATAAANGAVGAGSPPAQLVSSRSIPAQAVAGRSGGRITDDGTDLGAEDAPSTDEPGALEDGALDQVADATGNTLSPGPESTPQEKWAVRRLRALVVAEVLVAAVILGVTSVLVQTTPARSAAAVPNAPSVQSATMKDKLFILTVDVEPASVGLNDVHLYASTPDGQPADIKEWTVRAASPEQGIEPIDATVLPVQADHAIGQIGIPSAGTWTFTFTLRTTEIDQSTVTTQVIVNP